LRLWYYLCSGSRLPSPPVHPTQPRTEIPQFSHLECDLLRRYAAYLYYRSRGWVVRPGLALGGVHFLLYAQGPAWRHAAFGVVVDRAEMDGQQLTCAALAVHVRVVHSVGKGIAVYKRNLELVMANSYATSSTNQERLAANSIIKTEKLLSTVKSMHHFMHRDFLKAGSKVAAK
ncbi:hypothetical protein T265_15251, partial [Opisthorchis viverrini]